MLVLKTSLKINVDMSISLIQFVIFVCILKGHLNNFINNLNLSILNTKYKSKIGGVFLNPKKILSLF